MSGIGVILQALYDLGKKAVKGFMTACAGMAVVVLYLLGLNEILLLVAGAAAAMLVYAAKRLWRKTAPAAALLPLSNHSTRQSRNPQIT